MPQASEPLLGGATEAPNRHLKDFGGAFKELFRRKHWYLAGMLVWGVVTMLLGVSITVLKQADILKILKSGK